MELKSLFLTTLAACAVSMQAQAATVNLAFDSLPSAQGWTYFSDGPTPPTENAVFSLAGGVLSMDSTPSLTAAYYRLAGIVDEAQPFSLSVTARVLSGHRPLGFYVSTNGPLARFNLSPGAIYDETNHTILATLDTSVFHTYRMEGNFGIGYSLYVDDVQVATGSIGANNENALIFGDTGGHGVGAAELLSFSFSQPSAVPEPSSLLLMLVGLAAASIRGGSSNSRAGDA